jgi:glucose-6-phosphate dehydrogenase assembly protein OpcA
MSESTLPVATEPAHSVPLSEIEHELQRQLHGAQGHGEAPVQSARMSNLVIYCDSSERAAELADEVPGIVAAHPARVLFLVVDPGAGPGLTASVNSWCHGGEARRKVCSEQVTLRAGGGSASRLPYNVRPLLIGDLPTNLWWASTQPPPLAGPLLYDLSENIQQVIYDSRGWPAPAQGIVATAAWLAEFERGMEQGRPRVAADLNWRRFKPWRRLLGQTLDPSTAPGALETIDDVLVEHGPHGVTQACEFVGWLAARLGWRVQSSHVRPGTELEWQCASAQGTVRLRLRRLAGGASEIRRVRVACRLDGQPGAFDIAIEEELRLAVRREGVEAAPRTVTLHRPPLADLITQQLSSREHDPIFSESMAAARELAQSVLHG